MSLTEKLTDIKSQTEALLNYANETTEAGDTRLGDAVRTLVDGYGGGGGGLQWVPVTEIPAGRSFSIDIGDVDRCVVVFHFESSSGYYRGGMGYNKMAKNILNLMWYAQDPAHFCAIAIDNVDLYVSQMSNVPSGVLTTSNVALTEKVRSIQPHWVPSATPVTGGYVVIPY